MWFSNPRGASVDPSHHALTERPARRRAQVLPPSSGPTQVRTTPEMVFRAVVSLGGEVELNLAL